MTINKIKWSLLGLFIFQVCRPLVQATASSSMTTNAYEDGLECESYWCLDPLDPNKLQVKEPRYLSLILHDFEVKVEKFVQDREQHLNTPHKLAKHAFSVFISMRTILPLALTTTLDVAYTHSKRGDNTGLSMAAAWRQCWLSDWDGASQALRWSSEQFTHPSKMLVNEAVAAFGSGLTQAKRAAVELVNEFLCTSLLENETAFIANKEQAEKTRLIKRGILAFRETEKSMLNHLYLNLDANMQSIYEVVYARSENIAELKIFTSHDNWHALKQKYYTHLKPDELRFLSPWLKQLDRLVAKIDGVVNNSK